MSEQDDLRDILGEELFNELDSLDRHGLDIGPVDENKLMEIATKEYMVAMPFKGEQALDLVAALFHAAENGCKDCEGYITKFSGQIIGAMWLEILKTEDLLEEE